MDEQSQAPRVLLVEDEHLIARAYAAFLSGLGCHSEIVGTGREAVDHCLATPPDLVLLDLLLPDMHGLEVLEQIRRNNDQLAVIVVTTEGSADSAVKAIHTGATDYLVKPLDQERLNTTVHNALQQVALRRRLAHYEQVLPEGRFEGFIGSSSAMQVIYRIIDNAAVSDANVFITGESGTGKEVCAEAIHRRGRRSSGPFVPLNCAAIPRELMESELFGHAKGAFTGATTKYEGAAQAANGGTLFFDEICEMDLELQAKLLRFVQTRRFRSLGTTGELATDVRFICATNRDPWEEVQAGRFREDLYYRLFVVPITLPPLRERDNDILMLANHFLRIYAAREQRSATGFSTAAQERMLVYSWPGNIRQLQNIIQQALVFCQSETIEASCLELPSDSASEAQSSGSTSASRVSTDQIRPLWLEEKEIIERALEACQGNTAEAAARLEISDSTIYRKRAKWSS